MKTDTERKSKTFWAVTEWHGVEFVTGWECPNAGMWWVPKLRFSGTEGHHLFKTKEAAKAKALAEIEGERAKLQHQEAALLAL